MIYQVVAAVLIGFRWYYGEPFRLATVIGLCLCWYLACREAVNNLGEFEKDPGTNAL